MTPNAPPLSPGVKALLLSATPTLALVAGTLVAWPLSLTPFEGRRHVAIVLATTISVTMVALAVTALLFAGATVARADTRRDRIIAVFAAIVCAHSVAVGGILTRFAWEQYIPRW